ncbi:MAG: leucine-rich repeat protein, partial [Clostridia bacterium]|nr:leucine-rich repeat protein [Clostridia bacterium]
MKFCPECGAKYDGGGICRTCHTRFSPRNVSDDEMHELLLFRDFKFERVGGGIHLISCINKEIEEFTAPAFVSAISPACFKGCDALETVDLSATAIKELPSSAFCDCTELCRIALPKDLEVIGPYAFSGCTNLDNLTLPEGLTEIGDRAFLGCDGLFTLSLPTTLAHVGEKAFAGCEVLCELHIRDLAAFCRITFEDPESNPTYYAEGIRLNGVDLCDLRLPDEITRLLPFAFACCVWLESLHVPANVQIDPLAFYRCDSLESITVDPAHRLYTVKDNCLLKRDGSLLLAAAYTDIPATVKRVCRGALCVDPAREELVLPRGAVAERGALFGCCGLTTLERSLPLGEAAAVSLRELCTVDVRGREIVHTMYEPMHSLARLVITEAARLERGFFYEAPATLAHLTLPDNLTTINPGLLGDLKLKSLTIPRSVTNILPPFYGHAVEKLSVAPGGRYILREG